MKRQCRKPRKPRKRKQQYPDLHCGDCMFTAALIVPLAIDESCPRCGRSYKQRDVIGNVADPKAGDK